MSTTTAIDPTVDLAARLWQHLCATRLNKHVYVIDQDTQHCRPGFRAIFETLVKQAESNQVSIRTLIDALIDGSLSIRRERNPTFNPRTEWLSDPKYVKFLLAGAAPNVDDPRSRAEQFLESADSAGLPHLSQRNLGAESLH